MLTISGALPFNGIKYISSKDTALWQKCHFDEIIILGCPNVVKMTTSGTATDEHFVKMAFPFQWIWKHPFIVMVTWARTNIRCSPSVDTFLCIFISLNIPCLSLRLCLYMTDLQNNIQPLSTRYYLIIACFVCCPCWNSTTNYTPWLNSKQSTAKYIGIWICSIQNNNKNLKQKQNKKGTKIWPHKL